MAKRIIDYYNLFVGAFVTIAAAILGEHWYLFAAFLALNVVDWLTGWYKANKQGVESSKVGLKGALKSWATGPSWPWPLSWRAASRLFALICWACSWIGSCCWAGGCWPL